MRFVQITFIYFLFLLSPILSFANPNLLPVDEAFKVSAKTISNDLIHVNFEIAEAYYLYQHRFFIESQTESISVEKPVFPKGEAKHDEAFGDVIVHRDKLSLPIAINNPQKQDTLKLLVKYQGCADIGVCYPPQQKTLELELDVDDSSSANNDPLSQLVTGFKSFSNDLFEDELLPAEQAFQFFATVKNENTLSLQWLVAEGYYLYREKITLRLLNSENVQLAEYEIPEGKPTYDEAFGKVEIFYTELKFDVALLRQSKAPEEIVLEASFQGCADKGVCYPPMSKTVSLQLPQASQIQTKPDFKTTTPPISEQNQIANSLQQDTFLLTLLSFLGFGLLLSFTPCIFPMIPILSGIIVGQGKEISILKGFLLSLSYVIASALTYTIFGILAALFGSNLQVLFQQTWVIVLFSSVFILLSLSMFGFYHLELPKSLQAKLHNSSDKHRDGSYLGAGIMGALSSLIVGPCVAAPLAGALIYIGQTGDVVLGASALFMMGLGMGIPLLVVGASAGKLLPKAGHWLNATKAVFGVIMLGVSIWMLERVLPASLIMLLWAILLIISSIYLHALEALPAECNGWRKLWKGLGLVLLIYGVLLLVGASAGNKNPLQPLHGLGVVSAAKKEQGLIFKHIKTVADLDAEIENAAKNAQWVMLDFYADWCISCKEMEAYTFTDLRVKQALSNFVLLQADVTANDDEDKALLKRFNLIGPPAILFFGLDKKERAQYRVIGYQDSDTFLASIKSLQ